MDENEIAVGTALVPVATLRGYEQMARLARSMMKGWRIYANDRLEGHERQLLERQIVNMGEIADFFAGIARQHEEWIGELTGERRG